ncbi:hypothetical protein N9948_01985 [bacterium]|nr:hypothetical protein [bacterium]
MKYERYEKIYVVSDPENHFLNGRNFRKTGENSEEYFIEYEEQTFSVKKEYCQKPEKNP